MRGNDIAMRLWWRVSNRDDPYKCWEWSGATIKGGYGVLTFKSVPYYTHIVAWEVTFGPVPKGLKVLHTCDNPPCCNPDHLFIGTQKDNMQDASEKGRLKGRQSKSKLLK